MTAIAFTVMAEPFKIYVDTWERHIDTINNTPRFSKHHAHRATAVQATGLK